MRNQNTGAPWIRTAATVTDGETGESGSGPGTGKRLKIDLLSQIGDQHILNPQVPDPFCQSL